MMMLSIFVVATLVLTFFELLLPGGILGVLAAISLFVATWFGFDAYGLFGGMTVFLGTLVALVVLSFLEIKLMAKTPYGRKFFLNTSIDGHSNKAQADDSIIGKKGIALTRLNPSGKITINGKNYEAYSQDGFIENGQELTVIAQDDFKLTVEKL
jgi:membrane-bound ClpP family serine protease